MKKIIKTYKDILLNKIKYEYNLINFNEYSRLLKNIFRLNFIIYLLIKDIKINIIKYWLFKIKLYNLDLLIYSTKIKNSYKYCLILYKQYPNFKEEINTRYFYILKRFNKSFQNKENIILRLNKGRKGIIFITDSIYSRNYLNLIYSFINKRFKRKVIGTIVSDKTFKILESKSSKYDICNLHLSKLFSIDKYYLEIYINQFIKLKNYKYKLNLIIYNYSAFKNNLKKGQKKLLFLRLIKNCNNIYVSNKIIQENITKLINKSIVKVINYDVFFNENIFNLNFKSRLKRKNRNLDINYKYTLYFNNLENQENIDFLSEMSEEESGELFSQKECLIIFLPQQSKHYLNNKFKKIINKLKQNKNIEIIFQEFFEFWEDNYYLEYFKLASKIIIYDDSLDFSELCILSKLIDFKLYFKYEFQEDFNDIESNSKKLINSFLDFKTKFENEEFNKIEVPYQFSKRFYLEKSYFSNFSKPLYTISRIIGNDLPPLHSKDQTINNLKYIIKNEELNSCFVRIWILNRIIDQEKLIKIKSILANYNEKFYEIHYNPNDLNKCNIRNIHHSDIIFNSEYSLSIFPEETKFKLLNQFIKNQNSYLINNNGARNLALKIGRSYKTKWNLVFDGNIYIPKKHIQMMIANMQDFNTDYLIFPMARSKNFQEIESSSNLDYCEEPQIAFNKKCKEKFNSKYVYGAKPKIELFQRILLLDRWNSVRTNLPNYLYEFNKIKNININYSFTVGTIRLPATNNINTKESTKIKLQKRSFDRDVAIYNFIRDTTISINQNKKQKSGLLFNVNLLRELKTNNIDFINSENLELIKREKKNLFKKNILFKNTNKSHQLSKEKLIRINNLSINYFFFNKNSDIKEIIYALKKYLNSNSLQNYEDQKSHLQKKSKIKKNFEKLNYKYLFILLGGLDLINVELNNEKEFVDLNFEKLILARRDKIKENNYIISSSEKLLTDSIWIQLEKISIDGFLNNKKLLFESFLYTTIYILNLFTFKGNHKRNYKANTELDNLCLNLQLLLNINFIFINKIGFNLFDNYQENNSLFKAIIYLYESSKDIRADKKDYLYYERFEILFHIARYQSKLVQESILENSLTKKNLLPSNCMIEKGIPVNWKLMVIKK